MESKKLIPTSFGPSEDQDIVIKKLQIANHMKTNVKQDLSAQIQVSDASFQIIQILLVFLINNVTAIWDCVFG